MMPYVSPYTIEKRWFRVDYYPIFDDKHETVIGVAVYGHDTTDRINSVHSLAWSVAPYVQGAFC